MIILKFSKEYDKISWNFLFDVLKKFGMALEYVDIIHILFIDVRLCVNVNGSKSPPVQIQHKVRHGRPHSPYLFILVGEMLNVMVKQIVDYKDIARVLLPRKKKHLIS
jgi:hypothetical protein